MERPRRLFVQMSGAPGSGKSTIARLLAKTIGGIVINHDLVKAFFLENGIAFEQSSKLTYALDWVLAEDMLQQGQTVIIDSICNYDEVIRQGTALANKYGYDYRYVECRVDDIELLDQRLRARTPLRSQRTGVGLPPLDADGKQNDQDSRALFRRWIDSPCRPADNAVIVDSTGSPEQCLNQILGQIPPLQYGERLNQPAH